MYSDLNQTSTVFGTSKILVRKTFSFGQENFWCGTALFVMLLSKHQAQIVIRAVILTIFVTYYAFYELERIQFNKQLV